MIGAALIHAVAIVIAAFILADPDEPRGRGGYTPLHGVLPPPPRGGSGVSMPARPPQ